MEDISSGAKIGIGLVILCFLVMISLSLLMMVKNITNSGASTLQSGLDQMMNTQYNDYDGTIKTGTEVVAATRLFNGQPIAIVVITTAGKTASPAIPGGFCYGAVLTGYTKESMTISGEAVEMYVGKNALTASTDGSGYVCNLASSGASVVYNLNTRPMTVTSTPPFVRTSAKFLAELIRDTTGTIVGIVFTQQT